MAILDTTAPSLPEQGSPGGIQSVVRAMTTVSWASCWAVRSWTT